MEAAVVSLVGVDEREAEGAHEVVGFLVSEERGRREASGGD